MAMTRTELPRRHLGQRRLRTNPSGKPAVTNEGHWHTAVRKAPSACSKGRTMKAFTLPAIAAGPMAIPPLGLPGAPAAAPPGALDAAQTVGQLQARAFEVTCTKSA